MNTRHGQRAARWRDTARQDNPKTPQARREPRWWSAPYRERREGAFQRWCANMRRAEALEGGMS